MERKTIIGWSLNALPMSFGPRALKIICWSKRRIANTSKASTGLFGLVAKTTKTGGIKANSGPTRGIIVKIPATRAIDAAKSTEKILRTIQVATPDKIPKIT